MHHFYKYHKLIPILLFFITLGNINHLKILDHNKEKVSIPTEETMKITIYVQKQK